MPDPKEVVTLQKMTTEGRAMTCGDCADLLPLMQDASADAFLTDPPYGTGGWFRPTTGAGADCHAEHEREPWDVWAPEIWLPQARRISRGPIAYFCPQIHLQTAIADAEKHGDKWRLVIWVKTDPKPNFGMAWGFEPIMLLRPLKPSGQERDTFPASSPRRGRDAGATGHPHEKPLSLLRWLVTIVAPPGGSIIDPFTGSGTTGVAALREGRRFHGFEQDAQWAAVAARRIKNVPRSLTTFGALLQ